MKDLRTATKIESQKARGLQWLLNHVPHSMQSFYGRASTLAQNVYIPEPILHWDVFVRACPVNPRHGVLESFRANMANGARDEIQALAKKMVACGEGNGGIVVQPYIKATANAVLSSGSLVVAPDNDGVTAGKLPQLTVPVPKCQFLLEAEAAMGQECELEYVVNLNDNPICTQVRAASGHFAPSSQPPGAIPGFIGEPLNIADAEVVVIEGTEHLAELEALNVADKRVLVIHKGGSIGSHAAAWARQKGYAFIAVVEMPENLEWLSETARGWVEMGPAPLPPRESLEPEWFEAAFYDGVDRGLTAVIETSDLWLVSIFQLYASGLMRSEPIAWLAGYAAAALSRLGIAIGCGEARHESDCSEGGYGGQLYSAGIEQGGSRDEVYEYFLDRKVTNMEELARLLVSAFSIRWNDGYGGAKWANIVIDAYRAYHACENKDREKIIEHTNTLANVVHNSGWAFNKFGITQFALNAMGAFVVYPWYMIQALAQGIRVLQSTTDATEETLSIDVKDLVDDLLTMDYVDPETTAREPEETEEEEESEEDDEEEASVTNSPTKLTFHLGPPVPEEPFIFSISDISTETSWYDKASNSFNLHLSGVTSQFTYWLENTVSDEIAAAVAWKEQHVKEE